MMGHMPRLIGGGGGIVFAIMVILALSFVAFKGCERPALTDGERDAQRIENERTSIENELELEKMRAALALEASEAESEHAIKILALELELEKVKSEHKIQMDAAQRNAAIANPVSIIWGLGKVFMIVILIATLAIVAVFAYGLFTPARQMATRKSEESYADQNGLFPMRWTVDKAGNLLPYEPNRALAPGAHIDREHGQITGQETTHPMLQAHITGSLLEVQKMAALGQILVNNPRLDISDLAGLLPAPADDDKEPVMNWPGRVNLTNYLDSIGSKGLDSVFLGVSCDPITGQQAPISMPMDDLVHFAVAGSSGYGKTTFVESLLYQFVKSQAVDLAVVDLKGELVSWRDADALRWPVATTRKDGSAILTACYNELQARKDAFESVGGAKSLDDYNARSNGAGQFRPLVAVLDEATVLLKSDKELTDRATDLVLLGRSFGLWLVLSAQDFKVNSTASEIRNQLTTRVQFHSQDATQARVLLGHDKAQGLGVGRAICRLKGKEDMELQAPVVTRQEIDALLRGQGGARQAAPVIVDVEPVKKPLKPARLSANEQERARELGRDEKSTTAILKDIFGQNGKSGPRALAVNMLLGRVSTGVGAA